MLSPLLITPNKRRKKKKAPAIFLPRTPAEDYARQMRIVFLAVQKVALRVVQENQSELGIRADSVRHDEVSDMLDFLAFELVKAIRVVTESTVVRRIVERFVQDTGKRNKDALDRQFKAVTGIGYPEIGGSAAKHMDLVIADGLALYGSLGDEAARKVHGAVSRMVRAGAPVADIGQEISTVTGFTKSRATLIARDQTNKLHGELNRIRQTEVGLKEYTWNTSLDERVRPEHAERHGQVFKWDDPPDDGHPGNPVLCRCIAVPVIEI